MKTLQLTKFYPPVRGGIETVSYELTTGLNGRGIRTDVLCANTQFKTVREVGVAGQKIVRAASLGRVLSTSMSGSLIRELVRIRGDYDIIHVQLPDPMACLALWFARPSAKLLLHWQSDVVNQKKALKFFLPLQLWVLERADVISTSSPAYAEHSPWLKPYLHKVKPLPLGIQEPASVGAGPMAEWRARYPGRSIIFSLGRMTYYKGFDVLIDAASHMADDAVILVGGSGELLEEYRAAVKQKGLGNRIEFLGPLDEIQSRALFQTCDIFCLPSIVRAEAFGVVLVEAMTAARPLVATEIPGSGVAWVNAHGKSGLNVPVRDPIALARAFRTLLDDADLRRQLGAGARARYESHFTAAHMVDRAVELYRSMLEDG